MALDCLCQVTELLKANYLFVCSYPREIFNNVNIFHYLRIQYYYHVSRRTPCSFFIQVFTFVSRAVTRSGWEMNVFKSTGLRIRDAKFKFSSKTFGCLQTSSQTETSEFMIQLHDSRGKLYIFKHLTKLHQELPFNALQKDLKLGKS